MLNSPNVQSQNAQTVPHGNGTDFAVSHQPLIIQAADLVPDEIWLLEYSLIGDNGWVPYTPRGQQLFISTLRNPLVLSTPGRYRLVFGQAPTLEEGETFTSVAQFAMIEASSTHELLLAHVDPIVVTPGLAGPAGPSGGSGAPGAIGPQGIDGPTGADGAVGPAGAQGPPGPDGPQGLTGPGGTGSVGPAGPAGADGAVGPTGATGATGATGSSGSAVGMPQKTDYFVDATLSPPSFTNSNTYGSITYHMPFIAPSNFSVKAMQIYNSNSVANSWFRFAIYDSNGADSFYPGTLLAQTPDVDASVGGIQVTGTFPAPLALTSGHLYWLTMANNSAGHGTECYSTGIGLSLMLGLNGTGPNHYKILIKANGYGAGAMSPLPATSTANAADRNDTYPPPHMMLKVN